MYAKSSTSLLRICVYAQKIQCGKTLLSEIIIRNFCACTPKSSTSLLRICVYVQKIQHIIIIKSSNNPTVDVLRPAQKLQVWNTYIPGSGPHPHEKSQKYRVSYQYLSGSPPPPENHKATKLAVNVGPSSARQRNAI